MKSPTAKEASNHTIYPLETYRQDDRPDLPDLKKLPSYTITTRALTSDFSPISSRASTGLDTKNPSKLSQWITNWITDWWGLELICWLLSALSVLAIVIVLETYKNKPLPQWPLDITINSLISVFAQIGQMAMMTPVVECISQLKWLWFVRKQKLVDFQAFDDASRGPTGSLILIGKLRGLHLVILGAIIAVFSIVFGAFAQQVVTYPLHLHPSGNATTPMILNITGRATTILESTIENALSNAVASNGSVQLESTPSCSTGNCTWPEYRSLGFCSNVTDLSSNLAKNHCDVKALNAFFRDAGLENPGYPCFNYTLPFESRNDIRSSNLSNSFVAKNATLTNAVPFMVNPPQMEFLAVSNFPGTSNFSFVSGYIIYQPNIEESLNSTLASPLAFGFDFGICLQTYETAVENGVAVTTMVSSQPFDLEIVETADSGFQTSVAGNADPVLSVGGIDFGVTGDAVIALTNIMMSYFDDNCYQSVNLTDSVALGNGLGPFCVSAGLIGQTFLNGLNSSTPLASAKNIAHNIATSLTNSFLAGAGGNSEILPFQGTAFSPLPFVGTNYLWLIYPIGLISLTFVFLLATIFKSQRLGSKVWKSSTIATLQGLETGLHANLGGLSPISEMEENAKSVMVNFYAKQGDQGRLVEVEKDTPPRRN